MSFELNACQICGDLDDFSIGWHYGVITCQACKKFFIRSEKLNAFLNYKCNQIGQCPIGLTTRTNCQYCRYFKCKQMGMDLKLTKIDMIRKTESKDSRCLVCDHLATGIHFGVLTCEGCKSFYLRSVKNDKNTGYKCKANLSCENLSSCRFCRFKKCVAIGMSHDSCKTGRPTNLMKYQQAKRENSDELDELNPNKKSRTNFNSLRSNENCLTNLNYSNWLPSFSPQMDVLSTQNRFDFPNRFLFSYDFAKLTNYSWDYNLTNVFNDLNKHHSVSS